MALVSVVAGAVGNRTYLMGVIEISSPPNRTRLGVLQPIPDELTQLDPNGLAWLNSYSSLLPGILFSYRTTLEEIRISVKRLI